MATLGELWQILEEDRPLREKLTALAEIEDRLPANEPEFIERLERCAFFGRGPLQRAIGKLLLRWRRQAFHRETVSSSPTLSTYRDQGRAELAARALKDPGASARLDFLEKAAREEIFDAAPVLANRLLLEADVRTAGRMAEVLGMLGRASCVLSLRRAARHEAAAVRLGAVLGLGHQVDRDVLPLLVERLGDSDRSVREAAYRELQEREREPVLRLLEKVPPGKFAELKAGAIRLLAADLDDAAVYRLFQRFLADPDPRVYSEALMALVRVGDPPALKRLEALRSSDDPRIQKVVALATELAEKTRARPGSRP